MEDFEATIPYIRHQARAIVVSLKALEDSMQKLNEMKREDGTPFHKLVARSVREKALEIAIWSAALNNEEL